MLNFKHLAIWQKGIEIAKMAFELVEGFPKNKQFGLGDQISRAAVSIPSNIAEGSARLSEKEYNYYIQIALGSSFELETQLLIVKKLGYGNSLLLEELLLLLAEEQRMLFSFSKKLVLNAPPKKKH